MTRKTLDLLGRPVTVEFGESEESVLNSAELDTGLTGDDALRAYIENIVRESEGADFRFPEVTEDGKAPAIHVIAKRRTANSQKLERIIEELSENLEVDKAEPSDDESPAALASVALKAGVVETALKVERLERRVGATTVAATGATLLVTGSWTAAIGMLVLGLGFRKLASSFVEEESLDKAVRRVKRLLKVDD
jgi:hypothetical protein